MSRSGYTDEESDQRQFAMWRGAVASAIRGRRGQALLREMADAMDAMPVKRLIADELRQDLQVNYGGRVVARVWQYRGRADAIESCAAATYHTGTPPIANVCAIGTVGDVRGIAMEAIDSEDAEAVATAFNIAHALAAETQYMNDEYGPYGETPEARWTRMRAWVASNLKVSAP